MAVGCGRGGRKNVTDRRNELIPHGNVERGVGSRDGIECSRGANHTVVLQIEKIQLVALARIGIPFIIEVTSHRDKGEEPGSVAPVATQCQRSGPVDGRVVVEL